MWKKILLFSQLMALVLSQAAQEKSVDASVYSDEQSMDDQLNWHLNAHKVITTTVQPEQVTAAEDANNISDNKANDDFALNNDDDDATKTTPPPPTTEPTTTTTTTTTPPPPPPPTTEPTSTTTTTMTTKPPHKMYPHLYPQSYPEFGSHFIGPHGERFPTPPPPPPSPTTKPTTTTTNTMTTKPPHEMNPLHYPNSYPEFGSHFIGPHGQRFPIPGFSPYGGQFPKIPPPPTYPRHPSHFHPIHGYMPEFGPGPFGHGPHSHHHDHDDDSDEKMPPKSSEGEIDDPKATLYLFPQRPFVHSFPSYSRPPVRGYGAPYG